MPDAELRRQRAAYRRGLLRATSVAALIVAMMTGLSLSAMSNAQRAHAASTRLEQALHREREAVRALELALAGEQEQRGRADRETKRALDARRDELRQRLQAQAATQEAVRQRQHAEGQRRTALTQRAEADRQRYQAERQRQIAEDQRQIAEARREESRSRLVRLHVANGWRLADDGDLLASLPWFTAALRLDQDHGPRERIHRARLAAVLRQCPRLIQTWTHGGRVNDTTFSPDGRRAVTASSDQTARVWDVVTGRPVTPPLKHGGAVRLSAFSPDGRLILTVCGNLAQIWDVAVARPVMPPLAHRWPVNSAQFSPDGRRIVTASGSPESPAGEARVWDSFTGQPLSPPLHEGNVFHAAFSPDGGRVVTASRDADARVWNAQTGEPITPPLRHPGTRPSFARYAAFSPDGRRVVTAGSAYSARVWDAATGEPVTPLMRHGAPVGQVSPMEAHACGTQGPESLSRPLCVTTIVWQMPSSAPTVAASRLPAMMGP
jgi:hypothetical protein